MGSVDISRLCLHGVALRGLLQHLPGEEPKYYSIDQGGDCGEACISDSMYPILKMFEPGLLKADPTSEADDFANEVCKAKGLPVYRRTVSHGVGALKVTLDLYTSEK